MFVAPYVGAWIETSSQQTLILSALVAPYVGAWIETRGIGIGSNLVESHPTWVRGLKLLKTAPKAPAPIVAPYVGAWIETPPRL